MHQKTAPETRAMLAGPQQPLKDVDAIGREELAALKAQQRILAIDVAGAQAQMDAAAKLLFNHNRLSPSRIEQLECIKTATEIELARLGGRQKTVSSLIARALQQLNASDTPKAAADPRGHEQRSNGVPAPPPASHEAGVELLDYCEALCADDLKFHDSEELPPAPLSHDRPTAQPAPSRSIAASR